MTNADGHTSLGGFVFRLSKVTLPQTKAEDMKGESKKRGRIDEEERDAEKNKKRQERGRGRGSNRSSNKNNDYDDRVKEKEKEKEKRKREWGREVFEFPWMGESMISTSLDWSVPGGLGLAAVVENNEEGGGGGGAGRGVGETKVNMMMGTGGGGGGVDEKLQASRGGKKEQELELEAFEGIWSSVFTSPTEL